MIRAFSVEELAKRFRLSDQATLEVLQQLKHLGLLIHQGGKWHASSAQIHLGADDVMAKIAHCSWRNQTINVMQSGETHGFHYSAIHSLSKRDLEFIRAKIKSAVLECRSIIDTSPAETLAVFSADWYEV